MSTLSILIPAHNEEETIGEFVEAILSTLTRLSANGVLQDYEVIILDDGSTDRTTLMLQEIEAGRTRVIFNHHASGIHRAFLQLYSEACMEWILLVPGDAQWPASEIERLLLFHFQSISPLPTVTRRRAKSGYSPARVFVSSSFGWFAKLFLKSLKYADPGSIKILPRIAADLNYRSNSVVIEIERMMYCEDEYGGLREFEIEIVPRVYGSSSTITLRTLKPILFDCCKMIGIYKLLGKSLTNNKKGS